MRLAAWSIPIPSDIGRRELNQIKNKIERNAAFIRYRTYIIVGSERKPDTLFAMAIEHKVVNEVLLPVVAVTPHLNLHLHKTIFLSNGSRCVDVVSVVGNSASVT